MPTPEELARLNIDKQLTQSGWLVQDRAQMNLYSGLGVAVREFPLETGFADYLLFVDRKAVGVVEAKSEGTTLSGVAEQAGRYSTGLPANIPHVSLPLPFLYESTGVETYFRNERDPQPRSRRVFTFHRPETLADLVAEKTTLRGRFQQYPPLNTTGLWKAQIEAIDNLEVSLAQDKPRALIQMATGSGKTFTAVSFIYRLIKFGKARRVLFLVDRANLARQTRKEFEAYTTPDDGRKFTELYNVQQLQSNAIDPVNRVVITTIQRLYSILCGEETFDEGNEEGSLFELGGALESQSPKDVRYNPRLPIEFFDVIVTDECHRSIYNLWRQVLEYFDAHLIGLTATPSKQTFGFFNQNLVMEYPRMRAVADGVNVDGEVYRIRTQITEQGGQVESGYWVGKREKLTRRERWEQLDEELSYEADALDREVVSEGQLRTIARTFRDKLFTEIFPGRTEVPKTLVFAKDDSHAEDVVRIFREEFGKGDEFCQKITYRTTGVPPETLIANFRNSYNPRIAVTVDMIATGTDIKPLEILLFLRAVKSRVLFEQMLGRGTRVIQPTDLQAVTPDARSKERFVIVDAVRIIEQEKIETQTLERKRSLKLIQLMEMVALGSADEDALLSLAGRLARLAKSLTPGEAERVRTLNAGTDLAGLARNLVDALELEPGDGTIDPAEEIAKAVYPLAAKPELRSAILEIQARDEQTLDTVSQDVVLEAGFSPADTERARTLVASFEAFLAEHRDEITALQIIYNQPYGQRALTFEQVRELAETLERPPRAWTTEALWRAYAALEHDRVRGVNERRVLADVVALVRHAVRMDDELEPYPERVAERYAEWLKAQSVVERRFTAEQRWWLDKIAEHVGVNLSFAEADFATNGELADRGGQVAARRAFGVGLGALLDELNVALGA
jgi:type I restriction enzyme R subunit